MIRLGDRSGESVSKKKKLSIRYLRSHPWWLLRNFSLLGKRSENSEKNIYFVNPFVTVQLAAENNRV